MVDFCVLGRIAVVASGRELVLGSTREAALLADLLVHAGQVVPSSRLIDDIWRGSPPPGAAATLQTYVKNLRRILEPSRAVGVPSQVLVSRRPGYLLNVGPSDLDAWRGERLIEEGRAALSRRDPALAADRLRSALALWRGPAYGELAAETYLLGESARLDELRLVAIEERVQADLALGRHAELCGELEALVAEYPFRETLWGQRMLALYRAGRQADALRAYQSVRHLLGEELGIEPNVALRDLEEAILLHQSDLDWTPPAKRGRDPVPDVLDAAGPVPLSARLKAAGEPPFVGRGEELTVLLDALKGTIAERHRRVVLVGGEPGIGKTALVGVFSRTAHESGSSVIYGRCDEDLGAPYQPWATAVSHLVDHSPAGVLDAVLAAHGADLSRLSPTLSHLSPAPTGSPDPEMSRYLLFDAVLRVLQTAARGCPVVVVLDDLHWVDVPTLRLLRHLVGSDLEMPLLIVGAFRTSDIGPDHPLNDLLAWLEFEPGVTRIDLKGLDSSELSTLLEANGGISVENDGAVLCDALAQETDGNPFFVGELVRHLVETGLIARDVDGRWSVGGNVRDRGLPKSVRSVIARRAARLGTEAVRVLSFAAVMGHDFDLAVLATASGRTEDDLLDVLDSAIAATLVVNVAGEDFSFAHALVGHALYEALAPARRIRAHRRIAEAIEEVCRKTPGPRITELAYHYAHACPPGSPAEDIGKAISHARAAGDAALENLAPDEALRWYRQALTLVDRVPDAQPAMRCTLLVGIGDAQRQTGDPGFRETLLAAGRLALQMGQSDTLVAAALANSRGIFSTTGLVDDEHFALVEAALNAAGRSDTTQRARLLGLLALERLTSADYRVRRALVDEAVAMARRLDDPATLLAVLVRPLEAIRVPDSLSDRLAITAEAEQLARRLQDPIGLFWTVFQRTYAATESGDVTEADRCQQEAVALASRIGQPTMRWLATLNQTWLALLNGDAHRAEALAGEALHWGLSTGQPDALTLHRFQLHIIRWHQGRGADVVDIVEALDDDIPLPLFRAARARLYFDLGRRAEAQELLAVETERGFPHLRDLSWLAELSNWAEVAAGFRDRSAVDLLYEQLLPWSTQVICTRTHVAGAVAHYLGILDAARRNYGAAVAHFDQALTVHRNFRAPFHLARTHLEWGRTLFDQALPGCTDTAGPHLRAAREIARGAGCALVQSAAEELLREADSPQPEDDPPG